MRGRTPRVTQNNGFPNTVFKVILWPPGSPDLNIIENVWSTMKNKLEKLEKRTLSEWTLEIQKIWDEIGADLLKSLFDSSAPHRNVYCRQWRHNKVMSFVIH
jgi:hypothetical protein